MKKFPIETIQHSTAHLLAAAVKNLYPNSKLGIGPVIENGFYYDFAFAKPFSSDDLAKVEAEMRKLVSKKIKYEKILKNIDEAIKFTKNQDEIFKVELVEDLKKDGEKSVSFYQTGDFIDLCTGPHVDSTSDIKAFKLTSISAAYWKGDQSRDSLTRIYGTAWQSETELKEYLEKVEQAKENDHRVIGKELGLFTFSDLVGQGLPLLTSAGATIRRELENLVVEAEIAAGYQHVWTPPLAKVDLYRKSGHYPYFKDSMYPTMKVDDDELILRPMTCPHHFILYSSEPRSYRVLPMRLAELAPLFRYEKSGELSGLMRVRMFTLTDAHIFCTTEQASSEISAALSLIEKLNGVLGLKKNEDFRYRLSLGDKSNEKKFYKDDKAWEKAEAVLRSVLEKSGNAFNEEVGEAAFYGPKIDIQLVNALGKEETAFTVQYDFVMPKRFDLKYIDESGQTQEPVVIHRSSIGALERVMAFLLEKHSGKLPFWLAPTQLEIVPIADRNLDYCEEVKQRLMKVKFRVEVNSKSEPMQAKIRDAQLQKIPFMLIIGDKEQAQKKVSIRNLAGENLGVKTIDELIKQLQHELPS